MKDISSKNACLFVIGKSKVFNLATRKFDHSDALCGKIQEENSIYCPKHVLFVKDHEQEYKRRAAKANITKANKAALAEALETSPLRSFNPRVPDPKTGAYTEKGM